MLCRKSKYYEVSVLQSFFVGLAEMIVSFELNARKIVLVFHVCCHAGKMILIYIVDVDPAAFACEHC